MKSVLNTLSVSSRNGREGTGVEEVKIVQRLGRPRTQYLSVQKVPDMTGRRDDFSEEVEVLVVKSVSIINVLLTEVLFVFSPKKNFPYLNFLRKLLNSPTMERLFS